MKLLRLKLGVPYRSLPAGFEIRFIPHPETYDTFDFHPYCLVGRNGSGKSNVLQVLASIFYHLECIYLNNRPDDFVYDPDTNPDGFRSNHCAPDAFELEYIISLNIDDIKIPIDELDAPFATAARAHILITKEEEHAPTITCLNNPALNKYLAGRDAKNFLPEYVIGYSSGHNEILSLPFLKMRFIHFDEYRNLLAKQLPYGGRPEGRLLYLDEQYSQAILLCLFLFPNPAVTRIFREKIAFERIRSFRIIIRRHHRVALKHEDDETKSEKSDTPTFEITTPLQKIITNLTACATCYYEDYDAYSNDGDETGAHDLYLDYFVNNATREAFRYHFGAATDSTADDVTERNDAASALNLFHALRALFTLNFYQVNDTTKADLYRSASIYANETIPTPASNDRIMRFKDFEIAKTGVEDTLYNKALSDGEHQLIHTIGLCLLFRYENALFLLDEPETHLNPDWRASYISTLRAALTPAQTDPELHYSAIPPSDILRDILITSHSPFIVSDSHPENVLVFSKNEHSPDVICRRPDFNTFGASSNAITIKIFGRKETIGDYAMQKIRTLRQRLQLDEDPDKLIDEAGDELGESVEKVIFINQALDRKEARRDQQDILGDT